MLKYLICVLMLLLSLGCNVVYKPATTPDPFETGGTAPAPPGCEEGRTRGVDC